MRKRELGFEIIVIYSQSPSYVYLNRLFGRIAMLIYTVKPGDTVDSIAAAYAPSKHASFKKLSRYIVSRS